MHNFDIAPGLDVRRVEAGWSRLPDRLAVEFFALVDDLSRNGPGEFTACPGEPVEDFLVVYAIAIPCYPGQWLRCAYDRVWKGFWYLGLGPTREPCALARRELNTLLLSA